MPGNSEDFAMKAYDFVHLVLHASGGRIQGRTKLQKVVYFAGVLTGMHEHLGYRAHYYGPYSSTVTAAVDELRALGFLEQRIASGGAIDSKGFEVARYDYALTDCGDRSGKGSLASKIWSTIKTAIIVWKTPMCALYEAFITAKACCVSEPGTRPQKLVEMGQQHG
jgi:uncharacterized protein YwgA